MSSAEQQLERAGTPATSGSATDRLGQPRPTGADDAGVGQPKPRRRLTLPRLSLRIALAIAGCLVLTAAGDWLWHWWTHDRFLQSTDDAFLQADQVAVSARVPGLVEQVLVTDNQAVSAGQPLLRIDDRDTRARLEQAVAQAGQAKAGIAQAEAQIRQQEAQIAHAQAMLEGAKSQLAFADRQVTRYAQLAASGAETSESYEQRRQNRDQARAQVTQDAASLLAAQRQIGTLQTQIEQASAQVEQAQAQGRQAQVDLDATVVTARIDGRIGDKTVQAGQFVQTGTRLMTIVPVQNLYVVANFKETQIHDMRIGQSATIDVDALDGRELHGLVESFSPGTGSNFALLPSNNATGNFIKIVQRVSVRIRVDADARAREVLVPGLSAAVAVDTTGTADPARVAGHVNAVEAPRMADPTRRQGATP
jgi:membrane fusion protein, multidrug efflux system